MIIRSALLAAQATEPGYELVTLRAVWENLFGTDIGTHIGTAA